MVIIVAQKIVTVYLSDTMYLWLYFDDDVKLTVVNRVKYIPTKRYNSYGIYVVILISNICISEMMKVFKIVIPVIESKLLCISTLSYWCL